MRNILSGVKEKGKSCLIRDFSGKINLMTSRRKYMGADIDQVLSGELEVDKFCATRSVSPRTAYIWCLERAKTEDEREKVKKWMKDYFEKGIGLL